MELCHRCGGELGAMEADAFCAQCGAAQLYLRNYEPPVVEAEAGSPARVVEGAVDWRTAIRCAAIVGAVASALTLAGTRLALLSGLSSMWFVAGPLIALAMYQKRRPTAGMDARVGARIGVVVGLAMALGLTLSMAAAGLVGRYGLHAMGNFDAAMAQQMQVTIERNASANPLPPELVRFFQSQEFRAGLMLGGLGIVTAVLLVFSTLGGALAGMARGRRA